MNSYYVPIMKCKKGEQNALLHLSDKAKDFTIPLIEISHSESVLKKGPIATINSFWENRKFFFYFMPEWYSDDLDSFKKITKDHIIPMSNSTLGIPVIDLFYVDYIDDWKQISKNGIAIRLRNNEFGSIETILNTLFTKNDIQRENTDLILDLQYVPFDDLFEKKSILKAAFSDIDNASDYRSIIISSVSYPKLLPSMEYKQIYRFRRTEPEIFILSRKLANRFKFNYTYSDYGPTNIEDISFVVGMSPNFKIRYTTFDEYLYIKGLPIKKGGLDISNVYELSKILVDSGDFLGANYSWADKQIYDLSQKILNSPGNLTTWVSYVMNHHITFILNQI